MGGPDASGMATAADSGFGIRFSIWPMVRFRFVICVFIFVGWLLVGLAVGFKPIDHILRRAVIPSISHAVGFESVDDHVLAGLSPAR